jgi:hypothetical protein
MSRWMVQQERTVQNSQLGDKSYFIQINLPLLCEFSLWTINTLAIVYNIQSITKYVFSLLINIIISYLIILEFVF